MGQSAISAREARHARDRSLQGVSYGERLSDSAVRGVFPEYGEMRNEIPSDGRWISPEDIAERRRVIFLGARLRKKLSAVNPHSAKLSASKAFRSPSSAPWT